MYYTIFIDSINYVNLSLRNLHITYPGNCLYNLTVM